MKKYIIFSLIVYLSLFILSCHRQSLGDCFCVKAKIPISVDWSVSELDPQNVSVLFFDENTGSLVLNHYFENNSNYIQSWVELPIGKYTVLVFNELPDQIKNLNIDERSDFIKIGAKGVVKTSVSLPITDEVYYSEPGYLASIIVNDFEVTEEMSFYTNEPLWYDKTNIVTESKFEPSLRLMGLIPLRDLSLFNVKIHLDSINNARMPALITLRNVSGTYSFKDNKYGMSPVDYQNNISNRIYDTGSTINGTISGQLDLFGVLGGRTTTADQPIDSPLILNVSFQLVDKERTIVTREYDITDKVKFTKLENGTILINLDIVDPKPLPYAIPEHSGENSTFETTLEDWQIIDIPLDL